MKKVLSYKEKEVAPYKKIAYSRRYEGYEGNSPVTFDLFDERGQARLKLTHEGLYTFPGEGPDFSYERFAEGWIRSSEQSIGCMLKNR